MTWVSVCPLLKEREGASCWPCLETSVWRNTWDSEHLRSLKRVYLTEDPLVFLLIFNCYVFFCGLFSFSFVMICTVKSWTTPRFWLCRGRQWVVCAKRKQIMCMRGDGGWVANYKLTKEKGKGVEGLIRGFLFLSSDRRERGWSRSQPLRQE